MTIDEPAYCVILKQGNHEVRDYAEQVVAEVAVAGSRFSAANSGFRLLAKYIFGANEQSRSIAMTAPVVQNRSRSPLIPATSPVTKIVTPGEWIVRFSVPPGSSLESLPTPKDDRVQLKRLPPTRYAVAKFSGLAREKSIERQTTQLKQFIIDHHCQAIGEPSLARYNPPWTPWFLRRNEVLIPLQHSDHN